MTRYGEGDYDPDFNNQGEFWWANVYRSLGGNRGQAALRELEQALLALPEPKLISGHLAYNGQVCTVGALVAKKKVEETGNPVTDVLEAMSAHPANSSWCLSCVHRFDQHGAEGEDCKGCIEQEQRLDKMGRKMYDGYERCTCFVLEHETDGGDQTACAGKAVGLTYSLAWYLGYVNDEQFGGLDPEQRFESVLAWVRSKIHDYEEAAA